MLHERRRLTAGQRAAADLRDLAEAQWSAEAEVRGLYHPEPLPVVWVPQNAPLADPATARAGKRVGDLDELVSAFLALPKRRLVLIGEAGAGKTTFALLLLLQLLKRWSVDQPVPVLLPVDSWKPDHENLRQWLKRRLNEQYPRLRALHGPGTIEGLVDARMVLPVLDGLDEMPDAARGSAMQRLNQQLAPKDGLILTCRVQEYADAVDKGDALRWAGVLPAQPVSATTAGSYLQSSSVAHGKRWQMVVDHLHASDSPLAQALSTPLMIWLARTAYAASASSPREMVSGSFSDRTAIEDHLLDSLVPAVFDDGSISGPKGGSWSARRASRYLSFLARHLTQTDRRDLAWRDLWATTQANTLVGILAILLYMYLCAGYFLSHAAAMRLFAPTIPTACAVTIGILGSIRSRPEASRPPRGHAGRGLMAVRLARPTLMGVGIVGVLLPLRGLPGPLLADAAITTVAAVGALAIIRTSLAWRTDVDSADPLQELRGERAVFLSMATALVVELGLAGPLLITPTAGFASRGTLIAYGAAEGLVTAFATGCGWPRWCQRT